MAQANGRTNGHSNLKFWGWRRENGRRRAQPRRHSSSRRPVERRLRGGGEQHQGHPRSAARLRAPAVRRGSRSALPDPHRHRLEPNVAAVVCRHRGRLDPARRRRHRQDRQARHGVRNRGNGRHHDDRQGRASPKSTCIGPRNCGARSATSRISGLYEVRRVRHHHGSLLRPTVGNMYDKLIPHGIHGCFGETSEITGAEHLAKERAASPEVGEKWYRLWKAYQDDVIEAHKTDDLSDSQPTKGNIAGGLTHRGEGPRQPREDRARVPLHRCARARGSARQGSGSVLHGRLPRPPNASR